MNISVKQETFPLREDETETIRVGHSRVLLELVIRAFQNSASVDNLCYEKELLLRWPS